MCLTITLSEEQQYILHSTRFCHSFRNRFNEMQNTFRRFCAIFTADA